ncbi:hypothetical protein TanjilG_24831 [Lupinus angustifolius]|uniref:Uncharacterized protein n=1 Tax=Lupinus angustifolius TaxID=3871 RepID=A0A394D979_LUPAN|nr:PREDICTED: uncharacterized protein LOC109337401 [Lupinus angustifolius]XP_019429913.1 PREDICTED: uncharacterized protein LOC109337401 [Lupinus angustifolius]OIW19844.1 hypothetical protein TanjilG_24831 [Lupinus angustifolius]
MKTISGNCVSSKQISLSKAAKILSKFVSADNGASQVTNAYLHRASTAFNELKQLHKELKSPHPQKKHKRHRTEETHDDNRKMVEKPVDSFKINQELNHGRLFGSENADEDGEKSTQTVAKFSQEVNGSTGYDAENGIGSEKHKKNKRKKHDGDNRVKFEEGIVEGKLNTHIQNETEIGRVKSQEGDSNMGTEEGKKQKKEKKKKNDKEGKGKLPISVENETEPGRGQRSGGDGNIGMEEGKRPKKEKKEGTGSLSKKKM